MWILELKVTPGLSGCRYVQRHCHALSRPLRAMLCAVLYIHPKFIHILEICARNVYNLACSILQLHCLKQPANSTLFLYRVLFVAAGIDGAQGSFPSSVPQTCLGRRWPGDLVASTQSWEEARPHFLCDSSKEELLEVAVSIRSTSEKNRTCSEKKQNLSTTAPLIHTSTQIARSSRSCTVFLSWIVHLTGDQGN